MKLPEKFQFRNKQSQGFTHSAKVVEGKVEVKWARGYAENEGFIPNSVFALSEAEFFVQKGMWIVVEDKKVEQGLPEKFQFYHADENILYSTEVAGESVIIAWTVRGSRESATDYSVKEVEGFVKRGVWKLVQENSLTPEQLRSNSEFREQIAALDHSIRLAHQDIEHKDKLIKSYMERQRDLQGKLVKES